MTASMLPLQERNKVALSKRETEDAENIPTLGSKPFISFEEDQTGGLTVTCTSEGWLPKPEVLWTDWNGDVLSKQAETELEMNDKGLFNIKSNIHTDAETLNGLSCVIKNNFLMKEQHSSPPKLERFLGLKLAKTIIGHFGKEVLLPCFFTLKTHPKNLEVSWVKTNFEKEIAIHSFTDGRITTETEGENFSSRTRLYKEELRHGNFSLRLMNVLLSDQGNYCCSVKTDKGIKRAFIQLYVASVGSNPFLSILSYQEETITFICKSQKWFPQPEVSWIGKDVQKFSDKVETKIEEDNEGLYQVKSVIVLQKDSITGLSCSIKNILLTEEKHTALPHPGSFDVIGPSEPVFAFIGEDVLLPCLCTINYFNTQIFDVKWIKTEHKNTEEVYTFIRGEKFGRKGQNYRSRATLYNEEFEHGNVSLKLSNFQVANAGNYSCSVKSEHGIRDAVIQVITAGIGPRPFISIVDFQSEEIKLVCESLNWDLKPEVSWMDEKGQNMNAFSETLITENEEHLFNVQSYLTLRSSAVKQVYCNIRDQMGKEYNIPEEGDFAVLGPRNPIVGVLGEDVLLPCMLMAKKSPHHFEIRWIKTKFPLQSSVTVYSFRSGMNVVEQVDEHYQNQGQLHDDFLSTGNISMKLSSIQLSDSGNYTCIVHTEHGRKAAIIELKVAGLGSEPSLDITSYAEHTVTVSCKSKGWFPEPEILWITEKGEDLTGSSATSGECNENGLFTIQSSITVTKNSVQHLTCMVRNTWITNQKSNTTPVPDNFLIVRPKSPVIAVMGENITLPCELQPNVCPSDMILEWVKVESDNQVTVLNYKKGPSHCLSYTEDYTTRAFVSEEEFCRGSLSLQLRNTQLSDMGSYICSVKSGKIRSSAKIDVYITDKPSEDTVKPPPQGKQKDDASEKDKKKKKEKVHPPPPVQDFDNDRRKKMIYSDCLFVLYNISIVVVPVIFAVLFFACIICRCCQKGRKKTLEDDVTEIEKSNMERELKALREQQDVAEKENKDMEKEIKTLHEQKEASEREKDHMEAEMKVFWKQKEAAESEEERMKAEMKRLCEQKGNYIFITFLKYVLCIDVAHTKNILG
ncbi:hemicentin-1-like [Protopterus annectens]|uniref:hemicentin-1-like n=1 Tax=Protopterus annectens TaxID=7888 RepID=UPI001CFAF015|nr:hemicentin-1-like [Protopterus annectens]